MFPKQSRSKKTQNPLTSPSQRDVQQHWKYSPPLKSDSHVTKNRLFHSNTTRPVSNHATTPVWKSPLPLPFPPPQKAHPAQRSTKQRVTPKYSTSTTDKKRTSKYATPTTTTNSTTTTKSKVTVLMQLSILLPPRLGTPSTSLTIHLPSSISPSPIFPFTSQELHRWLNYVCSTNSRKSQSLGVLSNLKTNIKYT